MSGGIYRISGSMVNPAYSAYNFDLAASSGTGSGNIEVSQFPTKSAYAFIHTVTTGSSGSLAVSGSLDGTNYFEIREGVAYSGSLLWFTIYDAVTYVSVNLTNLNTGSATSGSLYLVTQT